MIDEETRAYKNNMITLECILITIGGAIGLIISMYLLTVDTFFLRYVYSVLLTLLWAFLSLLGIAILILRKPKVIEDFGISQQ